MSRPNPGGLMQPLRTRIDRIVEFSTIACLVGTEHATAAPVTIHGLGVDRVARVRGAVARFDEFTEDNDPWGEHDCAALTVDGQRIIFKIDYFDRDLQWHSPDAADPDVTRRVLTIMLGEEY